MVEYRVEPDGIFKALSDPTRRKMIESLSEADQTIGQLAKPHAISFAAASKHVGVLEKAGVVTRRKRGRERVCSLNPAGLLAARDWVERYSVFWSQRLDALDAALKEDGDE
ncbi:ArsR/SmtB family transcription factor [Altererythrobacter sp. MF3-039]|uniref:ArsR/SmtB family transcription factor n=1 Tax=Altererythrobacter sp. MF3-039 TaxID=3252901 RepID=UPI00390CCCA7